MVKVILTFLEPILKGCIVNQVKSFWSCTDATYLALRLYNFHASYSQVSNITATLHGTANSVPSQQEWETRVRTALGNYLRKHLSCFEYPLHESRRSGHTVISLMMDPRYKSMTCLLKLLTIEEGKSCIEFYDTILLQKLLRVYERVYEQVHGEAEASTIADCQSRNLEENQFFRSFSGSSGTILKSTTEANHTPEKIILMGQ